MIYPSIDIQGSIISPEILASIRSDAAQFQQAKDFRLEGNVKLKEEISLAWQEAKGFWNIYRNKIERLKEGETGTTETRKFWMEPLFTNLGYKLELDKKAEEINGKLFYITHRDASRDNFPIYIGGYHESLDRKPENKSLKISPHAMVQEYLNFSNHLYALVTNGRQLRLLRDASRITRLSFLEFNLEKMMEEDLYGDFILLYRLLHASRMPSKTDLSEESIIEGYHQKGLLEGTRIRERLSGAVEYAIKALANGFLNHPANTQLREAAGSGLIDANEFYHHQLRLIYRLLFLFVIEERKLVYSESKDPQVRRFNQIYQKYYSLNRLRKLSGHLIPPGAKRQSDLWLSMLSTFSLFEEQETGRNLGIMALNGDIFGLGALRGREYDLKELMLSNEVLLNVLKSLSWFENEQRVQVPVNYGNLDVEEFGSVYEGLLEYDGDIQWNPGSQEVRFDFKEGKGRGNQGAHYTPEELVQPLIKHSLEYLIQDRVQPFYNKKASRETTEQSLLSLKVCDVACGSGHILLSAARRISLELARVQSGEEQPNPKAQRLALRQVIRNCIYGVDKNPLAVELCKVALWLESHNPGEPLSFLNHRIRCGDAIVGLARRDELEEGIPDEAFANRKGDEKKIAQAYYKKNKQERIEYLAGAQQLKAEFQEKIDGGVEEAMEEYKRFHKLPENNPEEIALKEKAYEKFLGGKGFNFLESLAHTQTAQFFIPMNEKSKEWIMCDSEFRQILRGSSGWQDTKTANARWIMGREKGFFHWFLNFPDVFQQGGFDCIIGNPPFLGGQKLTGTFGDEYLEYLKYKFHPIGAVDLVTFFFRRSFNLLKKGGFLSLISTNTIAQGKAREDGLDIIIQQGGTINHAVRSTRWPGRAAVEVALVTVLKGEWHSKYILAGREVVTITPYLDDALTIGIPYQLKQNEGKSFQGSIVLGKGFILEPMQAQALIEKDPRNKDVLFPYLNGDDLNNNPDQSPSRWVINFFDWPEEKAKLYPECYRRLEELVKPERNLLKGDRGAQYWWQFLRPRIELYNKCSNFKKVLVIPETTKFLTFAFEPTNIIYSHANKIIITSSFITFTFLKSNIHLFWVWKNSSTLESRMKYITTDAFDTFPFPQNNPQIIENKLEKLGFGYYAQRESFTLGTQLGLTKTYNLFHSDAITGQGIEVKDKQVSSLRKHLSNTTSTISFSEAINGILELRELHIQMDEAVLDAYGWNDIQLRHDFYEVDYLPENDRIRFTIHPNARKEILKRLLELNHKIHEEEVKAGLCEKKKEYKKKGKGDEVREDEGQYKMF